MPCVAVSGVFTPTRLDKPIHNATVGNIKNSMRAIKKSDDKSEFVSRLFSSIAYYRVKNDRFRNNY